MSNNKIFNSNLIKLFYKVVKTLELTITAKIKINPSDIEIALLQKTFFAYRNACNYVSQIVCDTKTLSQTFLHKILYNNIRISYGLRSQMACSVIKTVIAKYNAAKSNGHKWSKVIFKKPEYDLVWNRDYSLTQDKFSVNTLQGRIKVSFKTTAMEKYFDGTWTFGTAKLVNKYDKWFLHIPMTKIFKDVLETNINEVVGIDLGINFIATAHDSNNKTIFFSGKKIKHKRARYKNLRKQLQKRKTASSRKKLKTIGNRENRFVTDINHSVSKALISQYPKNTLFVIEDLTGIRNATERVKIKNRYVSVSWSFYQLRQLLEYKAILNHSKVIAVDPKYTLQKCPKCGHTERGNRNKKAHIFCCKACNYCSNDDRIGAMNLQRKGIEYITEVAKEA